MVPEVGESKSVMLVSVQCLLRTLLMFNEVVEGMA